jgi:hypothetical protein
MNSHTSYSLINCQDCFNSFDLTLLLKIAFVSIILLLCFLLKRKKVWKKNILSIIKLMRLIFP